MHIPRSSLRYYQAKDRGRLNHVWALEKIKNKVESFSFCHATISGHYIVIAGFINVAKPPYVPVPVLKNGITGLIDINQISRICPETRFFRCLAIGLLRQRTEVWPWR
jgi:hypothetical protein